MPDSQELFCGSTSTSQATEPWDYRFPRKVDVPTNQPIKELTKGRRLVRKRQSTSLGLLAILALQDRWAQ